MFEDSNTYAYICVTDEQFPRVFIARKKSEGLRYCFGPYPSIEAAGWVMGKLESIFKLRQCDDKYFSGRRTPCSQYKGNRCSAPCVGFIDEKTYFEDVNNSVLLLESNYTEISENLSHRMGRCTGLQQQEFLSIDEQLGAIDRISNNNSIDLSSSSSDCDLVGMVRKGNKGIVQVFCIRNNSLLGSKYFVFNLERELSDSSILGSFLVQHYEENKMEVQAPAVVYTGSTIEGKEEISRRLSKQGSTVDIVDEPADKEKHWIDRVHNSAVNMLERRLNADEKWSSYIAALRSHLDIDNNIKRVEVIVLNSKGSGKGQAIHLAYNYEGVIENDSATYDIDDRQDNSMLFGLGSILEKKYSAIKRQNGKLPDVLLVMGSEAEKKCVHGVFNDLMLNNTVIAAFDRHMEEQLLASPGDGQEGLTTGNAGIAEFINTVYLDSERIGDTAIGTGARLVESSGKNTELILQGKKLLHCEKIGVRYRKRLKRKSLKGMINPLNWTSKYENYWALRNLSFELSEGRVLGVIGKNGAGKSTLLRVLTGVLQPDEGHIDVNGSVSALLGLGTGFMSDLSGRDNLFLSAMYLGMSEIEMREKFDEIVEFAELENFIDTPIKHYSSGMKARLGFSLAISMEPDVLIVDEVLGAGDKSFQNKARKKMESLMGRAKAIVICSHSLGFIRSFCTEAIWLSQGEIVEKGDAAPVVNAYEKST